MKSLGLVICCIFALCAVCFAQINYAVLVEESPVGAGEIKPGAGVHTFRPNEIVTLTTVPKVGWHFVYWLGDVSDPTANRTMLAVDGPKIIIAVFERDEYELLDDGMAVSSGPESLTGRVDNIGGSGISGGGGSRGGGGSGGSIASGDDPIPEPVPEPHTFIILAAGTYICRKKRFFERCHPLINRYHPHRGPGPRNP